MHPSPHFALGPPTPVEAQRAYVAACAAWSAGRREEASVRLDEAIRLKPDFAEAYCMGGFMLDACGKPGTALRFYERALSLDPTLVVAHKNMGKLLFADRRFAQALAAFAAAAKLAPDDADAWSSKAGALRELGRIEESLEDATRALALDPNFLEAAINRGNALLKLDRMEEALGVYRQARRIAPESAAALCGEALALRNLGRYGEALLSFEKAQALGSREAAAGKGCLLLTLGDFERGFDGYERRRLDGRSLAEALGTRFPTWRGPGRPGERVLVLNDHGLGDTLQFVRYLPLMAAAGIEVAFLCPRKLHRLLSPTIGARIVEALQDDPFDAQIALSSLPWAFGTRLDTVPDGVPYIEPDALLAASWADRIGPHGFKIGIVWQGNPNPEADRARSFPLEALAPLASIEGVRLISLQKGAGEERLARLPDGMTVESLGAGFDSGADAFVDSAAACAHLDLIVTCDTSMAHLAGALGRPVWVALKSEAEWRWMTARSDSPWYPTMRLFRQPQRGDWASAIAAMAREIASRVKPPSGRIIHTPVSIGELLDKIAILRIKARRVADKAKLANVLHELAALEAVTHKEGLVGHDLGSTLDRLSDVNARLWDIEDAIRACERTGDFGPRFVNLARAVYVNNDERAAIKRAINERFGSALIEEKSYG